MSALTEMAIAAGAGGGLQIISEVFKIGGGLVASLRDAAISNNEQYRANVEAHREARDAAARRSASWLRATLGIMVFFSAFYLTFAAGLLEMPTSLVTEKEGFSMLWGLIGGGSKVIVTEAQGFVQGPEFWPTVRVIAAFVFGVGAVSTGRRLL